MDDRPDATEPAPGPATESVADADAVLVPRPLEAAPAAAPRGPVALAGTALVGFAMGAADVVPGFSGGTVALVAGIYERLIANVRQGAHTLSLLLRGRAALAWRALVAIEWPFVVSLLVGIGTAIVVLASTLRTLLAEQPVAMSSIFLGLVLGATVVAFRELREPSPVHWLVMVVVAVLVFLGLGLRPGTLEDPSLAVYVAAGAVAVCAMILPGVSGSFLLLLLGVYQPVLDAVADRQASVVAAVALGAVFGLAVFSTLLNWLLRRFHDLVLASLLGLMLGSVRILWPWPSDDGVGNPALGPPEGNEWLLAAALGLSAFAIVWMVGLLVTRSTDRTSGRAAA
jgi:putative membrane protein